MRKGTEQAGTGKREMKDARSIIEIPVGELKPYDRNARFNENAVPKVADSIKDFGFRNPIIIDKNMVIIAGHTRLAAAKSLGMKKVPCIMADDLTDEQARAFRLVDNRTGELAAWNYELLQAELDAIGMDLSGYEFPELTAEDGMTADELQSVLDDDSSPTDYGGEPGGQDAAERYELVVECADAEEQGDLYKLLKDKGFKVRFGRG